MVRAVGRYNIYGGARRRGAADVRRRCRGLTESVVIYSKLRSDGGGAAN